MSLRDEENKVFEEWKNARKFENFAKDGAGENFENEKVKLIFIGKETNKTNNTWDWREYLNNGIKFLGNGKELVDKNGTKRKEHKKGTAFNHNIYRWAKHLLEGYNSFKEYEKTGTEDDRKRITSKIAFMNLKKESGGSSTIDEELQEAAKIDKQFIKQQLDLYLNNDDIKILFLCGDGLYTPIADILGDKVKKVKKIILKDNDNHDFIKDRFIKKINDKLYIIKFYHFSYGFKKKGVSNNKIFYELIQNTKKILDENISCD
jgi:hypothetical protein